MQCLTFVLRGVEFAVAVDIVRSVVEFPGATELPSPLPCMVGVMDLRGEVLPVIDLGLRLGMRDRGQGGTPAVIVLAARPGGVGGGGTGGETVLGALVDEVREVVTLPSDPQAETGSAAELRLLCERYVRGVARHEGRLIVMLDAAGLFSIEELAEIRKS
jgi:purine-binding chemotaxis protein CheW